MATLERIRGNRLASEFGERHRSATRATEERMYRERYDRPRRGTAVVRAARGAAGGASGHVVRIATNPHGYISDAKTKHENKVGLALMLFFTVIAIAMVRKGRWPTGDEMLSVAIGSLFIAGLTAVAPDFVVTTLVVVAIILAITNANVVTGIFSKGVGSLTKAVAA